MAAVSRKMSVGVGHDTRRCVPDIFSREKELSRNVLVLPKSNRLAKSNFIFITSESGRTDPRKDTSSWLGDQRRALSSLKETTHSPSQPSPATNPSDERSPLWRWRWWAIAGGGSCTYQMLAFFSLNSYLYIILLTSEGRDCSNHMC